MNRSEAPYKTIEMLQQELEQIRHQLEEANETIEAIRTGQVDALVVKGHNGHELYTLKSADHSYRVFIEKMTEGAVTLNPDGLILYCNSQFAKMVQLPLSQVIGMSFNQFISPESKDAYHNLFSNCWRNDSKGEVLIVAAKQKTCVQLSLTTIEMEQGVALSIILTDLTSVKATQQQLKQNNEQLEAINIALEISNHDLQQFASVASHDLQEPLRKILVFSNLLQEKQSELTPTAIAYLNKIIESSGRMKTLIHDILNYSRLSSEDTFFEAIDLNDLIKEMKDDFELTIAEKQAQVISGHLPTIEANKGQIRQLFQNILSNALKFTDPNKPPIIHINAARISKRSFGSAKAADGEFFLITVMDNGIGFNQKYLRKIFALFERLNGKDKYEGTGIGMAIAKKIVDKHNGLITAESEEGNGATFKIILPEKQGYH